MTRAVILDQNEYDEIIRENLETKRKFETQTEIIDDLFASLKNSGEYVSKFRNMFSANEATMEFAKFICKLCEDYDLLPENFVPLEQDQPSEKRVVADDSDGSWDEDFFNQILEECEKEYNATSGPVDQKSNG